MDSGAIATGDLIGKPFVSGGRDLHTGMDCWGLIMEVYNRRGINLPDFKVDSKAFALINSIIDGEIGTGAWEEVEQPGDELLVVLMRIHPKYVTHVGAYLGDGRIIHTMENTGVVISRATALRNMIVGYYRFVDDN